MKKFDNLMEPNAVWFFDMLRIISILISLQKSDAFPRFENSALKKAPLPRNLWPKKRSRGQPTQEWKLNETFPYTILTIKSFAADLKTRVIPAF